MAKKLITASELRAEIDRRIATSSALDGDCRECHILTPRPVPRSERTSYGGSNWIAEHFSGPPSCYDAVMRIRDQVMLEYDCSDWD